MCRLCWRNVSIWHVLQTEVKCTVHSTRSYQELSHDSNNEHDHKEKSRILSYKNHLLADGLDCCRMAPGVHVPFP